jgi:hypothetical protein
MAPGDFTLDGGAGGSGDGVALRPDGGITLNSNEVKLHYAWIANATKGTVSKFDTRTGKEVARYYTAVPQDGASSPNGLLWDANNSPSRTAIDLNGDVWVANRAPAAIQGSVTKIANCGDCVTAADTVSCQDRNGDGVITTSHDANGDGVIDVNDPREFIAPPPGSSDPKQYDECVLFSTPVGKASTTLPKARALAVSAPPLEAGSPGGYVWVGIYADRQLLKLDTSSGRILQTVDLGSPWGPYGAVVDSQQRLWVVAAPADVTGAALALVDANTGSVINNNIVATGIGSTSDYGIAIDGKDRVWLAGWTAASAYRYDHGPGLGALPGSWARFDFSSARSQSGNGFGDSRGIAADDQGFIWLSGHKCSSQNPSCTPQGKAVAQLIAFNGDDGTIKRFTTAGGPADFIDATDSASGSYDSIGVGPDSDNNLWVNNYGGSAMKVDRNTGALLRTPRQPGNLYTYSDFTGYQLRHFTAPRGTFWRDIQGCGAGTRWLSVVWDATTPPRTAVQVLVKVADTAAALNDTRLTEYGPFTVNPADLTVAPGPVPSGQWIRVKFVLTSQDRQSSPVLNSFSVSYSCSGGLR